jgi:pyruvate,water dikinase
VFTYKTERGFDVGTPRIAVIVQRQVDSEVAGIGFSLNPVTNDYDEAVIDASWGLGSSVVEGRVSPDHFVVNKVVGTVVEETRGNKRLSTWVDADHGTADRDNDRPTDRTLTDAQLAELTDTLGRVERLYETPVDIEWAYAAGRLYLLQARPITTFVPLPPEMVTGPEERRVLYGDAALSKGMTTSAAISPLGLDNMQGMFSTILASLVGPVTYAPSPLIVIPSC